MSTEQIEKQLKKPFSPDDIEWRVFRCGKKGDRMWAMVLAYITSRAIMDRLDEVFGIGGWQDGYVFIDDNVVCKLSVLIDRVWITKVDGAPQTNFQSEKNISDTVKKIAFKGGISDALKRAAVKLGIGRYLYKLTETFVTVTKEKGNGENHYLNDEKKEVKGYWQNPELPKFALPEGKKEKKGTKKDPSQKADSQLRKEITDMLLEMTGGDVERAQISLKDYTASNDKVTGKLMFVSSTNELSGEYLRKTHQSIRKDYNSWSKHNK